jgi:hypothetical protein
MQKRVELHISRIMSNGVYEYFTVYCTENKAEAIRQKYKAMGYTVV